MLPALISSFFFFNDTATTEIYTLSLHDALPISRARFIAHTRPTRRCRGGWQTQCANRSSARVSMRGITTTNWFVLRKRSEEHTSELQSQSNLVCRLLLEKKKKTY